MKRILSISVILIYCSTKISCMSFLRTEEDNFLHAIKKDDLKKVQKLIEKGQHINLKMPKEKKYMVPTTLAFGGAFDENRLVTPLMYAAKYDRADIIEVLVANGAQVNEISGFAPLHVAAWYGNVDAIKRLIEQKAEINLKALGITPLMLAVENYKPAAVAALLAYGATVLDESTTWGNELNIAKRANCSEIIEILAKATTSKQPVSGDEKAQDEQNLAISSVPGAGRASMRSSVGSTVRVYHEDDTDLSYDKNN